MPKKKVYAKVDGPDGMSYYDHLKKKADKDPLCKEAIKKHYTGKHRNLKNFSQYDI